MMSQFKNTQVEETLKWIQQQMTMMMEQNIHDTSTSTSEVHLEHANIDD